MQDLSHLLEKNKHWSEKMKRDNPRFFEKLARQQSPEYLWIGCSDSRVPANQIVDLLPGEVFVHRNVANVIVHSDLNCLSVVQFAVDILRVKHIIICGHYGCGGILAALENKKMGLVDNWLRHVQDIQQKFNHILNDFDPALHWDILCELNAIGQAINLAHTTVIQDAWNRNQELAIHSWAYRLHDGIVHDLKMELSSTSDLAVARNIAIENIYQRYKK